MGIGNFGMWEMLIVGLIVLIFFGPRRLPEIARSAGKAMREFKRGMNEIQRELEIAEREEKKVAQPAPGSTASTPKTDPTALDTSTPSIQPPIPTFAGAAASAAAQTRRSTGRTAEGGAESGLYDGTRVDVGGEPTSVEEPEDEGEREGADAADSASPVEPDATESATGDAAAVEDAADAGPRGPGSDDPA